MSNKEVIDFPYLVLHLHHALVLEMGFNKPMAYLEEAILKSAQLLNRWTMLMKLNLHS